MKRNKKILKIISSLILTLLCGVIMTNSVYAATPLMTSIGFEQTYLTIEQTIMFNYTTLEGGVSKPGVATIKNPVTIAGGNNMITKYRVAGATGALETQKFSDVRYVQNYRLTDSPLVRNFELKSFVTNFTTGKSYTVSIPNETIAAINTESMNGYLLQAIIPDPKSVAADYCRKMNYELDEILVFNYTMRDKSSNVKNVNLGLTKPIETDDNLDDGYDIVAVNAGDGGVTALAILAIIAIAVIAVCMVIDLFTPDNSIDQTSITDQSIDQSDEILNNHTINVYVEPIDNATFSTAYDAYKELCQNENKTPTLEGFQQFMRLLYPDFQQPLVTYSVILNKSAEQQATTEQRATIVDAFSSVITIIIIIIIIIIIVIALYYFYKRKKKGGSDESKRFF